MYSDNSSKVHIFCYRKDLEINIFPFCLHILAYRFKTLHIYDLFKVSPFRVARGAILAFWHSPSERTFYTDLGSFSPRYEHDSLVKPLLLAHIF